MKLLITGIPGTGKTSIGNYLEAEKGFKHFDLENVLKKYGVVGLGKLEEFIGKKGDKKVITWGFIPKTDDNLVKKLQSAGFKMIWFDGGGEAARKQFLKRGDVSEELFDLQLSKIENMDLKKFSPMRLSPFNEEGEFLEKEEIYGLILGNCA